jgi:O-antigen/teichoic acid export membrane protein
MAEMKGLVKDTAIYGVSSILGRFLNWCLMPFYTYTLHSSGEYGMVAELYAWTAVLMVILTYGMETGFFRFANKDTDHAEKVYSTSLTSIGFTSLLFIGLVSIFLTPISHTLHYEVHREFIWMMAFTVSIDAFCAIPFAWLRFKKRPIFFASVRLLMIFVNIFFNLFFLWICPKIDAVHPEWINWFYRPDYGVGYVFLANVISTVVGMLILLPAFVRIKWDFSQVLLKEMLRYSLPLLILGVAGIMNQSLDKMILKYLLGGGEEGISKLGIYTACFKLGIVMMMFTQAFRYAYEPFVFSKQRNSDNKVAYVQAMKYYIIFSVFVFLGVMYYLDVLQYLIQAKYRAGLVVVPIVLVSYIFQGICFNLSFWYKLSDKTDWGAIISIIGLVVTLGGNLLLVPIFGYIASAWSSLVCFLLMMVLSWVLGQKYYPVSYDMKSALKYTLIAAFFYILGMLVPIESMTLRLLYRTFLLLIFVLYVIFQDLPWQSLPVFRKLSKKPD